MQIPEECCQSGWETSRVLLGMRQGVTDEMIEIHVNNFKKVYHLISNH